ncbi:MAG: hypothetical protein Q4A41_04090 [Bacillota bacterium]|nr:hypothetical protein [Bacillota bacterium]
MKKLIPLLLAVILIFSACGENPKPVQPTEDTTNSSQGKISSQDTTNPTDTSNVENTTDTAKNSSEAVEEHILIGKPDSQNPYDAYVPVYAFNEDTGFGKYIYVDREALIDYIDNQHEGLYFKMSVLAEHMLIPYFYDEASAFDENGYAIVSLVDNQTEQIFIINTKGEPVNTSKHKHTYIDRFAGHYLCYYLDETKGVITVEIFDKNMKIVKTVPGSGYCKYLNDHVAMFFDNGMCFDFNTLEPTECREDPARAMYSEYIHIADGYASVSDFSSYDAKTAQLISTHMITAYKKAIHKDGVLLTGYDYFIINPVKDSIFFVFDGKEYYFLDAKSNSKVMDFLTNQFIGSYEFMYYPGLMMGKFSAEFIYATDKKTVTSYKMFPLGDKGFFYYQNRYPYPSYASAPQLLLKNKVAQNKINPMISEIGTPLTPEEFRLEGDYARDYYYYFTNIIHIDDLLCATHYRNFYSDEETSTYEAHMDYYSLKSGDKLTLSDWFTDKDKAIAILIAHADRTYREQYPDSEIPQDLEAFFMVDSWERHIDISSRRFYITIPMSGGIGYFTFTAPDEDLELILRPEIYNMLDHTLPE